MSKELTPLDYFVALGQTCLMQSKNYKDNATLLLKNGKELKAKEVAGLIVKQLEALEIIKEYFVLTSEYGKVSLEPKKNIPEDKYDMLNEVLL